MSVFCELKERKTQSSGRFTWELSAYERKHSLFDGHGDDSLDEEEEEEGEEDEEEGAS